MTGIQHTYKSIPDSGCYPVLTRSAPSAYGWRSPFSSPQTIRVFGDSWRGSDAWETYPLHGGDHDGLGPVLHVILQHEVFVVRDFTGVLVLWACNSHLYRGLIPPDLNEVFPPRKATNNHSISLLPPIVVSLPNLHAGHQPNIRSGAKHSESRYITTIHSHGNACGTFVRVVITLCTICSLVSVPNVSFGRRQTQRTTREAGVRLGSEDTGFETHGDLHLHARTTWAHATPVKIANNTEDNQCEHSSAQSARTRSGSWRRKFKQASCSVKCALIHQKDFLREALIDLHAAAVAATHIC